MLIASLILFSPTVEPVTLQRKFQANETAKYEFTSRIQLDHRQAPVETFIPTNETVTYTFTMKVEKLKPDGIADVRFQREKISVRMGETFDAPPKTEEIKTNENVLFTLSPTNQILAARDESKKPPLQAEWLAGIGSAAAPVQDIISSWIAQMHQLAGFVNFFDRGPILPEHPVEPGATWEETVGYAPVVVEKGADKGKALNARIDYKYTYKGVTDYEGKSVYHIQGTYQMDTDAAKYIEELLQDQREMSPFKEIRLQLKGTVDYYLDRNTCDAFRIRAEAEGYFSMTLKDEPGGPVLEQKIRSRAGLVRK